MIIVEDPTTGTVAMPPHLAAISCPDNCQHEVPLLFQPILQYADVSTFGRGFAQVQERIEDNDYLGNSSYCTYLYTKLPWPGNSKEAVRLFSQANRRCSTHSGRFTLSLLLLNRGQGSCE